MTCTLQVTSFQGVEIRTHMNTAKPFARSRCAIANSLDLVGDKWSLLVVRDLLHGKRTYGELALSPEHIPTNLLAGSPRAYGECRHRDAHSLPTASGALRLHAYPEGQRSGRGAARVCALGQAAHTGYGHIELGASGRRDCGAGGAPAPQARKAAQMRHRTSHRRHHSFRSVHVRRTTGSRCRRRSCDRAPGCQPAAVLRAAGA